jgi:hypothetical protein
MRTQLPLALLAAAFACSLGTAPADARARVFVASYGNDENPCTFGSPCKTFQQAVNVVDAGGEVTAIDSAGFGPISISKSVAITSPDGIEAGVVPTAGGNAITIAAGANDTVVLRGLTLNGSGIGFNGIAFNSGSGLTVSNCVVRNFAYDGSTPTTGNGILFSQNSGSIILVVTNTTVSDNGNVGLYYLPQSGGSIVPTRATIDHVVVTNNQFGIVIDASHVFANVTTGISSSVVNNNRNTGIAIGTGSQASVRVSIDSTETSNNSLYGITAGGTAEVVLGRSVITNNSFGGIVNDTSPTNTFYSYGNNQINLNNPDINNPLNTAFILR